MAAHALLFSECLYTRLVSCAYWAFSEFHNVGQCQQKALLLQ